MAATDNHPGDNDNGVIRRLITCGDCGREVPAPNMTMHQLRACMARARRPTDGDKQEDDGPLNSKQRDGEQEHQQSPNFMDVDDESLSPTGSSSGEDVFTSSVAAATAAAVTCIDDRDNDDDYSDVQIVDGNSGATATATAGWKSCPASPSRPAAAPSRARTEHPSAETPSRESRRCRRRLEPPPASTAEVVDLLGDTPSPAPRRPQPPPQQQQQQQHQNDEEEGPGENQWACPQCTLYNHKSSPSCTACLYPNPERPPDPTRTERLIGGDDDDDDDVDDYDVYHSYGSAISPMAFVGGGALMGGILGAAGSLIHGRDPFSAAAEGAMTGVMGGAFLNEVLSSSAPSSTRGNQQSRRARGHQNNGNFEEELVDVDIDANIFHPQYRQGRGGGQRPISVAQARSSASITGGYPSMDGSTLSTSATNNADNSNNNHQRARPRSSFRVVREQNNNGTTTTTVLGGTSTTRVRRSQRGSPEGMNDAMYSLLLHSQLDQQMQQMQQQRLYHRHLQLDAQMAGIDSGHYEYDDHDHDNNVDGMGYEELLRAFGDGTENMGATEGQIASLPTRVVQNPTTELPDDARQCLICLEDIAPGETRKIMPCLHGFHAPCCDKWLRTNGSCPICKHRLR